MAEIHDRLHADLAELQRQLEAASSIDPTSRALIERVIADVAPILASENASTSIVARAAPSRRGSLAARLSQAAKQFEVTHPTLAGTLGSVIDALAQMGI